LKKKKKKKKKEGFKFPPRKKLKPCPFRGFWLFSRGCPMKGLTAREIKRAPSEETDFGVRVAKTSSGGGDLSTWIRSIRF